MEGIPSFVHLHVHTQYSLLEGAIRLESLFESVLDYGMDAVAITDSHHLFGAVDFYLQARKKKVKPIIGCEIHYGEQGGVDPFKPKFHHLVLLCKNLLGYQNLCQILTESYAQAQNQKAVVSKELLHRFGDGLIVLSGCLKGEIPYKILTGDESGVEQSLKWFKERFKDDFYLELQDSGIPEQDMVNEALFSLAKKNGLACVATVDCHYLNPGDAEAHEILQCIEHGRNLNYERSQSLVPPEYYLKSPTLMKERFKKFPTVCDQTLEIAKKCDLQFKFKDSQGKAIYHLPNFKPKDLTPEALKEFNLNDYFRSQAQEGLQVRLKSKATWPEPEKNYQQRLNNELEMIEKTGFSSYFLIVADFINWAKNQGIPVGPGRGSGAGSLVAYALRITDIDPIEFQLLFERFINPERISMPDFDIDFCQDRRSEVIDYVSKRYGSQNVCQIITFGKLQARAVIKDVGRVLGFSFSETDQLTKLMPEELNITVEDALKKEPRLREKMEQDEKVKKVLEYALKLEGLYRNAGIHAAGVIITEEPVVHYCPLYLGKDGILVTQFDKDSAEAIGLIKFDFLGLKTLTVIDHAVKLTGVNLEKINYSDPKVFALISSGDTDGVFQVESSGMKDLCIRLKPTSVGDLAAISALYRPGPLGSGMVDDFIDRKHGKKPISYEVENLASILKDTYGVILYQEQVMQIARELAGYSLGQADLLRRAMGKKKAEEMAEHREVFVSGATRNGLLATSAESIFDLMAKFAEYGFNKSHSTAYAVLTFQTAYLKTYFPAEFLAALMTTEINNTDKITKYINDAREHHLMILPPDVNFSQNKFSVEVLKDGKKAIRFGLEAIKGVGSIAVQAMIEGRTQSRFQNVVDFVKRVPTRKVNKKVLEALTLSGALDGISKVNRATLFNSIEDLLKFATDEQDEIELGQSSFFDSLKEEEVRPSPALENLFKPQTDWGLAKKLALERQVVGFYISGHPMDLWQKICVDWLGWNTEKVKNMTSNPKSETPAQSYGRYQRIVLPEVKIAGLLSEFKEITTKKGSKMAFVGFEDLFGKIEVVFFPEAYQTCHEMIRKSIGEAEPILLTGEIDTKEETPKIFGKSLVKLAEVHAERVQKIVLKVDLNKIHADQLRELKKNLIQNRGRCPVELLFQDEDLNAYLELPKALCIHPSIEFICEIQKVFGADSVSVL